MKDRVFLITVIEIEGRPVLRITQQGFVSDYLLDLDQVMSVFKGIADWMWRYVKD